MREQAIGFFLQHGITLARELFQARPVEYRDLPVSVRDHIQLLQFAGRIGDAFTPDAQYVTDELLGHDQLVRR